MRGRRRQAEQVGQRVERDQRRRAAHEAAQRRRRDEVGDRAEAQRADQELHRADQHGDGERERDVRRASRRAASGASVANRASELALVGPETTCQLEPNSAATMHGTTAVYRPYSGGSPASVAKAIPCGRTSSAPSTPATRSARRLAAVDAVNPRPEDARSELVHCARLSGARGRRRAASAARRSAGSSASGRRRSPWRRSARARASARR